MADERRIIGYDVDGYDVITSAVMDLLNNYPGLEENDEIRFSVLDLSSGKAMFPSAGAVITMERISTWCRNASIRFLWYTVRRRCLSQGVQA